MTPTQAPSPRPLALHAWWQLLRPQQWLKNALVLVPWLFSQDSLVGLLTHALPAALAFVAFSLMASAVYALNDVLDLDADRHHPGKADRPLVRGDVRPAAAATAAVVLAGLAVALSGLLRWGVTAALVAYLVNNVAYSLWFKRVQLLDVFSISLGFILRIAAGAAAIEVPVSAFLFLTVFFLTLFLAVGKRRYELLLLADDADRHRPVLGHYSVYYLDQVMVITATMTLIVYVLYVLEGGGPWMLATIPIVTFGLLRYFHVTHNLAKGEPSDDLIADPIIVLAGLAYGALVIAKIVAT